MARAKDPKTCVAVFNQNVFEDPRPEGLGGHVFTTPYHIGDKFSVTGGSENPNIVCEHAGFCVPRKALTFPKGCVQVGSDDKYGPYYGWEQH